MFKKTFALLLISAVLLFGCTQEAQQTPALQPPAQVVAGPGTPSSTFPAPGFENQSETMVEPVGGESQNSVQQQESTVEITVTAKQWEFQPSTVTVKKGDAVKLTITSIDVAHGFALPEFNVNSRLEPGQETVVEFVADRTGSFSFFCSVFCGSGHGGMRGTLVVTE